MSGKPFHEVIPAPALVAAALAACLAGGCRESKHPAPPPATAPAPATSPAPGPALGDAAERVGRLYNVDPPSPLAGEGLKALKAAVWYEDAAVADPKAPGHWKLRTLDVDAAFPVRGHYLVRERGAGGWLVGAYDNHYQAVAGRKVYDSLDRLIADHDYPPLPNAPEGFELRELLRLPDFPTRLASDGKGGPLFVLCQGGDVYRIDPRAPQPRATRVIDARSYLKAGYWFTLGLALGPDGRLYVVANERDESVVPVLNRVTIFRTGPVKGRELSPKPWLQVNFPYEIKTFNHGVSHLAFGPDGMLYVNSGSRTDAGEEGDDPKFARVGETDLTACIWQIDPKQDPPQARVFARGLRNAYGFCWDGRGRMFATDNGPNRDAPEELNLIEQHKHYGFPYAFSDLKDRPYEHVPKAPPAPPEGFVAPIPNLGPDALDPGGRPTATFTPHSSPSGIVYLGDDFPGAYKGTFLVARFGNLFEYPQVSGFDLLHVRLREEGGRVSGAEVRTLLSPLARPIDVHRGGPATLYVCEYSRDTRFPLPRVELPGRVLELKAKRP